MGNFEALACRLRVRVSIFVFVVIRMLSLRVGSESFFVYENYLQTLYMKKVGGGILIRIIHLA